MLIDIKDLYIPENHIADMVEKLYQKPPEEWREIYNVIFDMDAEAIARFACLTPNERMEWVVRKTFAYAVALTLRLDNQYYQKLERKEKDR